MPIQSRSGGKDSVTMLADEDLLLADGRRHVQRLEGLGL